MNSYRTFTNSFSKKLWASLSTPMVWYVVVKILKEKLEKYIPSNEEISVLLCDGWNYIFLENILLNKYITSLLLISEESSNDFVSMKVKCVFSQVTIKTFSLTGPNEAFIEVKKKVPSFKAFRFP